MLKKIRSILAACFALGITLLFLDFSGVIHLWLGWMAKIQFLPAILSLNVVVILLVLALTFLFGRIYCSIICPLGVYQDLISHVSAKFKKNRFHFVSERKKLRYIVLGVFVLLLVFFNPLAIVIAPYSAYGRMVSSLLQPIYLLANNLLAKIAEHYNSYAFYEVDVWLKSGSTLVVALLTWLIISILSWKSGRSYCNNICPVGTVLGLISKKSLYKITIDSSKCVNCSLCEKNCKSQAIDYKNHIVDYSRCVSCMDCIGKCKKGAISYKKQSLKTSPVLADFSNDGNPDSSLRTMLATTSLLAISSIAKAQEKKFDGGFAVIEDKQIPERENPVKPAGSLSLRNFSAHCTACQLCVSECPNGVLRPSTRLSDFMQPEMSFERGYCRPECTRCSEVCPTGAITKITKELKTSIRTGHAVWIKKNCIPVTDGVTCGNCAKHCPSGAITMVKISNDSDLMVPAINSERCLGCGACENLCPARPFSAIYVEGNLVHGDF